MGIKADYIYRGASFFPGKGLPKDADFIAVKGGRILAVGKEAELNLYLGDHTEVKSYSKRELILPGFFDAHGHILAASDSTSQVDLTYTESEEEAAELIGRHAANMEENTWIKGFGWYQTHWGTDKLPTAKSLDRHAKDHPVLLNDAEGHGVWVNSKALEIAGINKHAKDPAHGKIFRDADGAPTGYLSEMAVGLVARYANEYSMPQEKELIRDYMELANRYGVTATNDMMPGYGYDNGHFETYDSMAREKQLTMRIHAAPSLFSSLNAVKEAAVKYHSDYYQITLLKQFVDGVPTTYTALMLEPYADNPETRGKTLNDLEQLETAAIKAHQNGFSVHLHCCGDGAVRFALDSFEKAIEKYGATGSRHSIEHVETTTPEDIERFARLGVIASMQPEHLVSPKGFENNEYLSRFNERQKKFSWAFRSMMDAGVHVAFGSDCPIVSIDPFAGLYRAVTRLHDDHQPDGGWNPEQKLTIEEAIDSYTLQGAYTVRRENELGTLEAGKLADFIVLDQNLLVIDPEMIRKTKVLETVVGGRSVFSADRKKD